MIKSLCDTDLYKLTMMQVVFEKYTSVNVRYDFKCRNENIMKNLDSKTFSFLLEVSEKIKNLCELKFTKEELDYLKSIRFFKPNFIEYLRTFQLNEEYVRISKNEDDDIAIIIEGPWISTILFEVPVLAIVSETYHKHHDTTACAFITGKERLEEKFEFIEKNFYRDSYPKIVDLGTRRRFSYDWHKELIKTSIGKYDKILTGTSNIHFAMKYDLTPVGTMAHEYVCAHQQLGRVEDSQIAAFQAWADVYRGDLGIALSDTVGFGAFLTDFDLYFAKLFDGARHDSGDPYKWCERLIEHYEDLGIDPKTKVAVFSDGLTFELINNIHNKFNTKIKTSFGIGTNLTNDVGAKPLQIVMKMTECNGRPVAKISDSPGKGMCRDERFEKYIKRIFKV